MVDLNNTVYLRLLQASMADQAMKEQAEMNALGDALQFVSKEREGKRQYDLGREDLRTGRAQQESQFQQTRGDRRSERAEDRAMEQTEAEESLAGQYERTRTLGEALPDQIVGDRKMLDFLKGPVVGQRGPEYGGAMGRAKMMEEFLKGRLNKSDMMERERLKAASYGRRGGSARDLLQQVIAAQNSDIALLNATTKSTTPQYGMRDEASTQQLGSIQQRINANAPLISRAAALLRAGDEAGAYKLLQQVNQEAPPAEPTDPYGDPDEPPED